MKLAFSSLLVLTYVSTTYALFWVGTMKQRSTVLIERTDTWKFERSKCRFVHYNTCREDNYIVDRVEVNTVSGNDVIGELVHGGEEDFYIVAKLCGEGQTTYRTTIWGHFRGNVNQVAAKQVFLTFDKFWPCNHAVAMY